MLASYKEQQQCKQGFKLKFNKRLPFSGLA